MTQLCPEAKAGSTGHGGVRGWPKPQLPCRGEILRAPHWTELALRTPGALLAASASAGPPTRAFFEAGLYNI